MSSAGAARPVVAHRFQLALLRSPVGRLFGGLCELRFVGRVSGRRIALPVQCAREETRLVIYVGGSAGKQWWRNFVDGRSVQVRVAGASYQGHGRVVDVEHPDRARAEQSYRHRFRKAKLAPTDPIVVIDLAVGPPGEESSDRVKGG
jgi:hypothetical protein